MSETVETAIESGHRPATPWHLWVVGIVATIWNFGGALDYTMTQTRNESYMSGFTPEQLDYFYAFPAWADAVWALGVWGALIGSLLILFRSRHAIVAFAISLAGLIGSSIYQMTADMPPSLSSPGIWVFTALIWLSIILLIWYSRTMTAKGILR
ncbi:hypothetical protein [Parasphingorhabdus cellanae]|uniref:Sugar transporter n=1 Tax=Parasphingorhabdus cellanae TaxID=2806553 RepID=A0ABX7T4R5_9SPHN|nr:hypothetical protein [Parasphingorhabdus cellanae]QTD56574.1 hypothetical protein J4G78_02980 [Parasphingorhabdus cellanae]